MNRRRFLGTMLGALAAPAIVRASSLMPVRPLAAPTIGVDLAGLGGDYTAYAINVRAEALRGLGEWLARTADEAIFNALQRGAALDDLALRFTSTPAPGLSAINRKGVIREQEQEDREEEAGQQATATRDAGAAILIPHRRVPVAYDDSRASARLLLP